MQPADLESWRKRVEKELATASFDTLRTTLPDGRTIEPLYVSAPHAAHVAARATALAEAETTIEPEVVDLRDDAADPHSEQLASALATFVHKLQDGARTISFAVPVGANLLSEIAKLRALRRLTSRVAELTETTPEVIVHAFVTASDDALGARLIATSVQVFAAITGGADRVSAATPNDTPEQRRLADNVVRLALHESHLAKVLDPAAGSYALEALTDALCQTAWARFQTLTEVP